MFHTLSQANERYEVQDFQKDVIEASYKQPVLVDFWAPWCGPCRILGPVLEKLAEEQKDRWKLVKVNTDVHQDLALQYGIRGIPAVKLFVNGEVVDEFVGALPEPMIRQWLDTAIPDPVTEAVKNALELYRAGKKEEAEALISPYESTNADHPGIRIFKAITTWRKDPDSALSLIQGIEPDFPLYPFAEAITTAVQLLRAADNPEELPDDPVKELFLQAIEAFTQENYEEALEKFITVIKENRYYHDDASRKACLAIFILLGEDHPITKKYRPIFNSSLYI